MADYSVEYRETVNRTVSLDSCFSRVVNDDNAPVYV